MGKSRRSPKRGVARATGPRGATQIPVWPTNANNLVTGTAGQSVPPQTVARRQDAAPAKIPVRKTGRKGGR